jgi:hypothetical protein
MPVEIIDYVYPKNNGTFPTHDAAYGKGGYLSVADVTARNAIATARRTEGMRVRTNDTGMEWILTSDLLTWVQAPGSTRQDIISMAGTVIDIYVDISGDDGYDGLSYATAYRTIQAAIDSIPENLYTIYGKSVNVHLGTGTFSKFTLNKKGVYIKIIGDRRSPLETWEYGSKSFSIVSGYTHRASTTISAWTGTVDETTHWLELDYSSYGGPTDNISALCVLNSTSPTLHATAGFTGDDSIALHPFLSTIDDEGNQFELYADDTSKIELIGVKILSSNATYFKRVLMWGCYYYNTIGALYLLGYSGGSITFDGTSSNSGSVVIVDGFLTGCVIRQRALTVNSYGGTLLASISSITVKGAFTAAGIVIESRCNISDIDNETQRQGITVQYDGILEMTNAGNGIKIQGTPTRALTVNDGAIVKLINNASRRFSGAIAGVPVVITSGTVINAKACCNTFLTNSSTPGNEITVGANATTTFAAQPTTDLALGNTSTMSRAT